MTSTAIKAIPTQYAGVSFRSRLEARWAVFFDALNLPWQYEPEGFELPSGRYLPDFFLPTVGPVGTWFEVKGQAPTDAERTMAAELALDGPVPGDDWIAWSETKEVRRVVIAWGDLPREIDSYGRDELDPGDIEVYWDKDYAFCVCQRCGRVGIEFEARGDRVCPIEIGGRGHSGDAQRIVDAYAKARGYRFWNPT